MLALVAVALANADGRPGIFLSDLLNARRDRRVVVVIVFGAFIANALVAAAFGALAARGITRVMVEAGPGLANAVAAAGYCDEFALFESGSPLGEGLPAIGPALAAWRAKADLVTDVRLGPDRLRIYTGGT